ncbi:MAG: anti-sigma factor [Pseudomonadota bacterium]|nr:anti-sigma factor [Pseudomonadota bacterium]
MTAPEMEEEREALAAEFVLGTLSAAERADVVFRLRADPELKRAVEAWEARLSPLNETAAPIEPPEGLEASIHRRIAGLGRDSSEVVLLQRKLRGWQTASVVTGAIAAGLAALLLVRPPEPVRQAATSAHYVAVLQSEGPGPAFVATVDLERGTISVRRVAAQGQSGKSYELWALGGGRDQPQSLGVIDASLKIPAARLGEAASGIADTVFAITLEAEGGSPSGQPSGPPLFTGKLVATE